MTIINIKLNAADNAMISSREVLLPDGEVHLRFSSHYFSLGCVVGAVTQCDGKQIKFKTTGDDVDISALCDKAGELKISASLIRRNEEVKRWSCETLILKEIDSVYEPIPELVAMREEIAALRLENELTRRALTELKTVIDNTTI